MPSTPHLKTAPRFDRTAAAILDGAAHVFSEQGTGANLATVAAAASVSRATLYRYYPNREALLEALAAHALAEAANRLEDAGLEQAKVEEAIERILRALVAVGDRFTILVGEQIEYDEADKQRFEAPLRAVIERGIETGALRQDLSTDLLFELFGGTIMGAIKLRQHLQVGIEEASAAAAGLFLDGARPRD